MSSRSHSVLLAVLLLCLALIAIWLAPLGSSATAPTTTGGRGIHSAPLPTRTWLIVSSRAVLRTGDAGRHWRRPPGLPTRGALSALIPAPTVPGTAYAADGDVFITHDSGAHWSALSAPPLDGGVTVLALLHQSEMVVGAGVGVVSYNATRHLWRRWEEGWPTGLRATLLLPDPDGGLYAAVGHRLYYAPGVGQRWQRLPAPWGAHPVTALAVGPDGQTLFAAVATEGVWQVAPHTPPQALPGQGLPPGSTVTMLRADPGGGDLYAATATTLAYLHTASATEFGWVPVLHISGAPLVDLQPLDGALAALTADGRVFVGYRAHGQTLEWSGHAGTRLPLMGGALVVSPSGTAFEQRVSPVLPAIFTQHCLLVGPSVGAAYDVCGPFSVLYLQFRSPIFGWPRGPVLRTDRQTVRQVFDNAIMEVGLHGGSPTLYPLGRLLAHGRHFPVPTREQFPASNTAVVGHYFVEPTFYPFWSSWQLNGASIFGPPISQGFYERSTDGSGVCVQVQYFTNARLEYHATLRVGEQIQVSSLGRLVGAAGGALRPTYVPQQCRP